ncbi:hypothetical protein GCM10017786_36690 [Amycolatopsis deserti]|uniref:Uncharacterized protein n=1 Tax=Amycolatopsis deserti TaxID=185696 RepID=A0ABQ3J4P3_9PSEU|nr:hypothetical protein [Amycolatopsis deserti]GHF00499.1 hypothetical protein GCM10017786_36690 [Amycolatopsis deserti]
MDGSGGWQPVVRVGDHGLVLGLAGDGRWVLGRAAEDSRPLEQYPRELLPVLEQRYSDVARLTAGAPTPPPWDRLLRLALEWGGQFWPERALDWLDDGYPTAGLIDLLEHLAKAGATQRIRHRARRLGKGVRAKPPPRDDAIIQLLRQRDGVLTHVVLRDGKRLDVWNIAWGYDLGDEYAHVTTNISPDIDRQIDFFWTVDITAIVDPATGESLRP